MANDSPINLAVELGPLRLKNPVMVASGTFGYGQEYAALVPPERLGAVLDGPTSGPRLIATLLHTISVMGLLDRLTLSTTANSVLMNRPQGPTTTK